MDRDGPGEDITATLCRLREDGLARCADGAEIEAFLAARGTDGERLMVDIVVAHLRGGQATSERATEALLQLHLGGRDIRQDDDVLPDVAALVDRVEKELNPSAAMLGYLRDRASALAGDRLRRLLPDTRGFLAVAERLAPTVEGGWLRARFFDPVPLEEVLAAFAVDGVGLWRLRDGLAGGQEAFDEAVDRHWPELAAGVEEGLVSLFEAGEGALGPEGYLAAFRRALVEGRSPARVLDQIRWRMQVTDGFDHGPALREWFGAAALFKGWNAADLRRLVHLDGLLATEPDALLAALRSAVADLWPSERPTATFGALTLVRHARWATAANRKVADAKREEHCLAFVGGLEGGASVLDLARRLRDLPVGLRDERHVWSALADDTKAHWRGLALASVEDAPSASRGLIEYVLAWTDKASYVDLEPLVLDLLALSDERALLADVARTPGRPRSAVRAECLLEAVTIHPPVKRRARPGNGGAARAG